MIKILCLIRKLEQWLACKMGQRYPYQSYLQIKTSLDETEKVLQYYRQVEYFGWDGP